MALSLATFPLSWSADASVAKAADIATVTCDPVTATQPSTEPTLLSFDPQIAERIVDTRVATGGVAAPLGAGCTLQIDMSSVGASASEINAFALSVTVISAERGFFTAFPCAGGQPGTSSVNARPGVPTPNLVVGVPDATGMLCLFSERGGNVVVDVSGWWTTGPNRFTPIEPTRAYDTRALAPPVKLPANAIRAIDIAGVVVPDDAVSITLNLAAVAPATNGFLVVYPCGQPPPLASNLNFVAGEKRAVTAIVELGSLDAAAEGKLCVTGNATTHFLVDVTGYDAPSSFTSPDVVIEPVADARIVDTRISTVPGRRFAARTTQRFDLSSVIDRPDDAVAVVLNAVAVRAERGSFVSISPCTAGPPTTSSLNYDLNQTANLVVTALSPDGAFCVYADTSVDIVIDLVGVVTGPPGSLVNQLSFSEVDGTLAPLEQEFAVDGPDSTTRCDGDRSVRLRLGLAPRVIASVNGVGVTDRDPVAPDVPITLTEDGLLTIELARGAETATYYVRCLPADFPTLSVETAEGAAPGWYLTDLGTNVPGVGSFLTILNERGAPVWYQRLDQNLIDAKLLSTGDLVASENPRAFTTDPSTGHRVIALDGSLVDVHVTDSSAYPADKHDYVEIPELPEGRAIISYPVVTGVDLSALDPAAIQRGPALLRCPNSVIGTNKTIVDGAIRELTADGPDAGTAPDLRWEWTVSDYFSVAEVRFPLCFQKTASNPGEVDPFHINSISRVVERNCGAACDYVVAARHLDAVFRVDHSTKAVEWILSSTSDSVPNKSGAERLNIVGDPRGGPLRMHDAILDGNILTMHDNRTASGQPSRFVQYRIDTSDPVRAKWTATLTRQINAPFGLTSGSLGSARLAADGSVLMAWGSLQPVFVEYGADGTELLRIALAGGGAPYRIVKYAPDDFDADELRATAGNTTQPPS